MKRFVYAVMLLLGLGIMVFCCSCGQGKTEKNESRETEIQVQKENPIVEVEAEPVDTRPRVYANAFDGFVNIRESAQAKAPILGVFRNGPEGAVLLEQEGEWSKIDCGGIIGYVYTKYLQDTPTIAVDERIDLKWLEGWWEDDHCNSMLIFDNGGFMEYSCMFNEGSYSSKGSFMLQGTSLVLNIMVDYVNWPEEPDPKTATLNLDPINKVIVGYKKEKLKTKELSAYLIEQYGDEDMSYDDLYLTKKDFEYLKKHVFDKFNGY